VPVSSANFRPYGHTGLANPALGKTLDGTAEDPLAAFSRRPLDKFIIPEGGRFMDPARDEPHYGVDYTYPDDYLKGIPLRVHPIGPGYVTARSTCLICFVEGDSYGRTRTRDPENNFGFGSFILVETPYSPDVSIYVLYAHLGDDFVSLGDHVAPGEVIGSAGATGYAQEIHVHVEIRYGAPGRFWNADFSQYEIRDRWLGTLFVDPVWVVFPEHHSLFVTALEEWAAQRPRPAQLP
jgi:hypothetical protein